MKKLLSLFLSVLLVACCFCSNSFDITAQKAETDLLGESLSSCKGEAKSQLNFSYPSELDMLAEMEISVENEKFKLLISKETLAVALVNKATGDVFTSNPYNAADDTNYTGTIAEKLSSQILITYLENNDKTVVFSSSEQCVKQGQYTVNTYENGLSVEMSIGKETESVVNPIFLTPERYEELFEKLDERMQARFEVFYTLVEKVDIKSSGILDLYPDFAKQDIYYCSTQFNEREKRELSEALLEIGYTAEMYSEDLKELNVESESTSTPNVKLTLQYILTETGLKVNIPNDSISYNEDYPLLEISVLPYFGADSPSDSGNGYLFIPDGSGAVISMNNQTEARKAVISGHIYGTENTLLEDNILDFQNEGMQYYLPVFGIVRNNGSALFANIVSGDASSDIFAYLGQPNGNYYTVYNTFDLSHYERYTTKPKVSSMNASKVMYLYDKNSIESDLTIDYTVLAGEKASYSGMAEVYREYLVENGMDTDIGDKESINLQTIGSVRTQKSFLGFELTSETELTTYSQNTEILKMLANYDISDISLTLRGWEKNGLDASLSSKFSPSSKLGGVKELNNLAEYCEENDIPLSLEANVSHTMFDRSFDSFNRKKQAARNLNQQYAVYGELSPDVMKISDAGYIVSSRFYDKYISGFTKGYKKLGIQNLSLTDLGNILSSDFTKKKNTNRFEALNYVVESVSEASKDLKLEFNGANAYILPYATSLNEVPCTDSGYIGESYSVPFVQLAVSGYVKCRSVPINLENNIKTQLLYCIQSGTIPTFILAYDNVPRLKVSKHTKYYAVDFEILEEQIKEAYMFMSDAIDAAEDSRIVAHSEISDGVFCLEYENGKKVYTNFGSGEFVNAGLSIDAMSYTVV